VSPSVGQLDESAVDDLLGDSPDQALALLADLTGATDPKLRDLARALAARVVIDLARQGSPRRRGVGKLAVRRLDDSGADLDVDASIDGLALASATGAAPDPEEVRVRGWSRPGTALCLVVDRSGSMGGARLATAAVAAAAVAWRTPDDYSVLAFGRDVVVAKGQGAFRPPEQVVQDLLALRGFGTTDVALALQAAAAQLAQSRAGRRLTVLLSDGRATVPGDVVAAARALDELVIVAPEGDLDDALALAGQAGARCIAISGPSAIPEVFASLLGG
jgi:Mg-chelatase subunit ChlD